MKIIDGGITAPKGFKANAVNCGIRKTRQDLALIYSETPALACGLFTQNRILAAPIIVNKLHLRKMTTQAVVVNSGNANCCTGKSGVEDALAITQAVARELNLHEEDVLAASTGIIGEHLPMEKIKKAIPSLVGGLSTKGNHKFAQAILTTDRTTKEFALEVKIGKRIVRLGGVAKGSGMINPNMATLLCFITTDAYITRRALKVALKDSVNKSLNAVSIDGETSTNDTVIAMANGNAGGDLIDRNKEDFGRFRKALDYLVEELAKKIVMDGEGATKFVEILVKNAGSNSGARRVAKRIAGSVLFKTALFGHDPNWGRIAAAAGSSGVKFNPNKLDIYLGTKKVLKDGAATKIDLKAIKELFKKKDIGITIDLKSGSRNYRIWTTDLSSEYVKINAHYTT